MSLNHCLIVDSTLREGEQFEHSHFTLADRVEIAAALDRFGVDFIEVTSPAVSSESRRACEALVAMGLRARIAAHLRCHPDDVRLAIDAGITAFHLFMASSPILRASSHGRGVEEIVARATEVATMIRAAVPDAIIRFSCEDAFRSPLDELLDIYRPLAATGLFDRFGIADTVGAASPLQVMETVAKVRRLLGPDVGIEFHGHNDTGCATANAWMAVLGGATHIDTCVLGLGERNGITPLEALVAAMYAQDPEATRERFDLPALMPLAEAVAARAGIEIPFDHCVVGSSAFTHKAGVHSKAILANPRTYEVLDPTDFGRDRTVMVAHALVGRNVLRARADQLGYELAPEALKEITARLKEIASRRRVSNDDVDALIAAAADRRAAA
ncbi:homocitrate synthase [Azospirillum halopraeferens]|uniref:homocitrate synthase n=1 Tax=Azospirillum halopraeferens TaxID=34010 RepID=UPI000423DCB0|nr:homocitrate synthase [Azospirillum halopraeferens]